jgi:hypothetical protein
MGQIVENVARNLLEHELSLRAAVGLLYEVWMTAWSSSVVPLVSPEELR